MSGLEDRCSQFHEAALGTGKSKGAAKEIATLRKFLHKNQNQRFTEKAAARLFDTIAIYASHDDAVELLEDALKMPFTVFSTKHKTKMLKWVEERRGTSQPRKQTSSTGVLTFTIIDLDGQFMSLMEQTSGETYERVPLPEGDMGALIQRTFQETDEAVDIKASFEAGIISVKEIAQCKPA